MMKFLLVGLTIDAFNSFKVYITMIYEHNIMIFSYTVIS